MTVPLLQVRNLSKSFGRRGAWFARRSQAFALHGVTFDVEPGKTLGLVGESGSGKTTLARLLAHLTDADQGTLGLDDPHRGTRPGPAHRALRRRIQIVPQDAAATFDPRVRAKHALADPIRLHRLRPEAEIGVRVGDLFEKVGLAANLADRFPHELSGGQVQRLAIARALAVEPALLILDEVASALDPVAKTRLLGLLRSLQSDLGMTYVFISHNIADVHLMCDAVGVLFSGRLVELGARDHVFSDPRHPYTRALLSAALGEGLAPAETAEAPRHSGNQATGGGCAFAGRCPLSVPPCRKDAPPLLETGRAGHRSACLRATDLPATLPLSSGFGIPLSARARLRLDLMRKAAR